MSRRVGVDIGGTFTDFALETSEGFVLEKVLSTPADRSEAVLTGLERLAQRQGLGLAEFLGGLDAIVHGTTVADNTLIERDGAKTGLLTTEGFRDELELRRGYKEDIWDVRLPPPDPIVPRRRRLTVRERILHDGRVHVPLDEWSARAAIERLARQGVESVAISLLFAFVNPEHEQLLARWVEEALPGVPISLSHEVLPKAPEYERTSTTAVNAYVGPRVTAYLDRLIERLREAGYERDLLVMQSSGGVMSRAYLRGSPVRVLASGPAGGVIGAAHFGSAKSAPDLLCVDMGGTSYDVSVVRGGAAPAEPGWNWHHRHVLGLPMVAVETLGAGGGSLCQLHEGTLRVGPGSAGADPGPVCYGRGGTQPTVTDAILLLGLLSETSAFAGGRFALQRKGVEEAFEEHVAGPLGCSVEEAAFDCFRIVNANMTQAVRRWTAEKGTDPRGLAMLAYGGNGPIFAGIQAEELGIERVLVPKASPAFSALGALAAKPTIDEERSLLVSSAAAPADRLTELFADLDVRAARRFEEAGFPPGELRREYALNLRYPGQNWSLAVRVGESVGGCDLGFVTPGLGERAADAFHARHRSEYGHDRPAEVPEITGVRLTAFVDTPPPDFAAAGRGDGARTVSEGRTRRAHLGNGFAETPIRDGASLAPGEVVEGPAILEETFTTIVVYPGWRARLDQGGDYLLERG